MQQSHDQQMFIPGEWVTLTHGRYRIVGERCLGEGGQSAVWKAERESDGKTVVVRTVNLFDISHDRRDIRNDDEIKGLLVYAEEEVNFLKNMGEGQATQHFILPVLDDGSITHPLFPSHPLPTMVMPWYERGDLGQFVRSRRQRESFSAADLLRWARQLSVALVYIHQQHSGQEVSVHRDIKPKNVVLDSQGNVGLTDFGIVRAAASLGTSSVVGSFLYCAPEQVLATHRSANRHKQYLITPAVDIYSLAITLHELLAGQTEAQKNLTLKTKDRNTLDEHDSYLPPSGTTTTGKIGKLGKIGGLTAKEKQYLHSQILALFSPVTADQTIAVGSKQHSLPDARFIADGMTDLLERMLAPWPADRPTAPEVLAAFTALEQSFNPILEQLDVSLLQERISVGQTCTLELDIRGCGLPFDLQWLRFECDGQPLVNLKPVAHGDMKPYNGLISLLPFREIEDYFTVDVPLPTETGEYRLKVSATVAGTRHSQQMVCHVTLTAAQLWELGKHEEALRLELRQERLDALLQQATDLEKRIQLRDLLQRLQIHYSTDTSAQAQLTEELKKVHELVLPKSEPEPKRQLLFSVFKAITAIIKPFSVIFTIPAFAMMTLTGVGVFYAVRVSDVPVLATKSVDKASPEKQALFLSPPPVEENVSPLPITVATTESPAPHVQVLDASAVGTLPVSPSDVEQAAPTAAPNSVAEVLTVQSQVSAVELTSPESSPPTPEAQLKEAEVWLKGDDKAQWAQAIKQLEGLADSGNAIASDLLGSIYFTGRNGVKASPKTACQWYTKADKLGHNQTKEAKDFYASICK